MKSPLENSYEDADVRRKKYIHTTECSTSSGYCDLILNKDPRIQETAFRSQCIGFKNIF
jgi:hypothetical protein